MKHVFIIGSKGIPAKYGGFETFVEKLTEYQINKEIKYHVACLSDNYNEFEYNGAHCFNINVPDIGSAKAVYYDISSFDYCLKYIENNKIRNPIIYILACRIGPFVGNLKKKLDKFGGMLYVNPDGHEWKRAKWNWMIRNYWKYSEKLMVKSAGLLICDSQNIQKYIQKYYAEYQPETIYISYGCDSKPDILKGNSFKLQNWYKKYAIIEKKYYLAVGRFVPENNYEIMIREFMKSDTKKDFVLVTDIGNNKFYEKLRRKTGFERDKRIKFVGTVYEQELLKKIRENAYGYLHGHEVGGTNPSLLEALGNTKINLLLDVGFNREVAEDGAIYWNKQEGNLARIINRTDNMNEKEIDRIEEKARERINSCYRWEYIIKQYEKIFMQK